MLPLLRSLVAGARHLLIAVAVVATLASAFGVHLHVAAGHAHEHDGMTTVAHGHDHACASKLAGVLTADVAGDTDPQGNLVDPDGCGHCHCPVPTTDLPKPALLVAGITMIDLEHRLADMRVPDGLRLQPDPPPVRG